MRFLDLGCGTGKPLSIYGVTANDEVIGVDICLKSLEIASARWPKRAFILARGEAIPLRNQSVDKVVSSLAIPYMDLPTMAREVTRVLKPGGEFTGSMHDWRFTLEELKRSGFLNPKAALFRLFVLCSGLVFHFSGWSHWESFQTQTGMRKLLRRAGFERIRFYSLARLRFVSASRSQPLAAFRETLPVAEDRLSSKC